MIDQNWFINAVIAIDTDLEPLKLLSVLLYIEMKMGRIRTKKWGPRRIEGSIGTGGGRLEMQTVNGSIELARN